MKVFLSSTCYDLPDARAVIEDFLIKRGDKPLLSERKNFPTTPGLKRHAACVREAKSADLVILLIDRRRGASYYRDKRISVTQAEFRAALAADVPIYAFVRRTAFDERKTWKRNKNLTPAHVDDKRVFEFISEVQEAKEGIWMYSFADVMEIIDVLQNGRPPLLRRAADKFYQENTLLRYRDTRGPSLYSDAVVEQLSERHNCTPMRVGKTHIPLSVTWRNSEASIALEQVLGTVERGNVATVKSSALWDAAAYEKARKYIKWRYEAPPSRVLYESDVYCVKTITLKKKTASIDGYIGRYYDNILTQYAMEWELKKALLQGRRNIIKRGVLPLRDDVAKNGNAIVSGAGRCAALTISTLLVFARDRGRSTGLYTVIRRRSKGVGVSPGMHHVAPAGMFEAKNRDDDWSIKRNVWRELLEEVFNYESEIGDGTPETMDHLRNTMPIKALLGIKKAEMAVTGIVCDLLNVRTEICTILYIPNPAFAECGERMRLNWEYERVGEKGTFAIRWEEAPDIVTQLTSSGSIAVGGAACFQLGCKWLRKRHKL